MTDDRFPEEVYRLREFGYSIVPGTASKRPLVPWAQWRNRRQTDDEFNDLPVGSLYAIVTGDAHGLVVVDFDGAEGLAAMDRYGFDPNVRTGSGGAHVWALPPSYPVKTVAGVEPGVDVRGEGGLVWTVGRSRAGVYELRHHALCGMVPSHLLPERRDPKGGSTPAGDWTGDGHGRAGALRLLESERRRVAGAPVGQRNTTTNAAAYNVGGLVGAGELEYGYASDTLIDAAAAAGYGPEEAVPVVHAGLQAGMAEPWRTDDEDEFVTVYLSGKVPSYVQRDDHFPLEPPLDAFPPEVAALVRWGADVVQSPQQYILAATLPALAVGVGGRTRLAPKSTWHLPPTQYVGLVGSPGTSKTPAISLAMGPVKRAEAAGWVGVDGEPVTRYLVDDVTTEKLGMILNENPGGIIQVVDELSGFFRGMGQYKESAGRDRSFYLSAWSGEPLTIDRVKRSSLHVAKPMLSVVGGIQPEVFDSFTYGEPDGMMERFLLVYAEPHPRVWSNDDVPQSVLDDYDRLWNDLRDAGQEERVLGFTPDANRAFATWYNEHYRMDPPEELASLWSKVETHVNRIALILACCDHADAVTAGHVERAVTIVRYFLGQTSLVLRRSAASTPEERRHTRNRARLAEWIEEFRKKEGRDPSKGDILRYGPPGSRRARDRDVYLDELGEELT